MPEDLGSSAFFHFISKASQGFERTQGTTEREPFSEPHSPHLHLHKGHISLAQARTGSSPDTAAAVCALTHKPRVHIPVCEGSAFPSCLAWLHSLLWARRYPGKDKHQTAAGSQRCLVINSCVGLRSRDPRPPRAVQNRLLRFGFLLVRRRLGLIRGGSVEVTGGEPDEEKPLPKIPSLSQHSGFAQPLMRSHD